MLKEDKGQRMFLVNKNRNHAVIEQDIFTKYKLYVYVLR